MANPLDKEIILESLEWLSDWLRRKHPDERFELVLVGGAALALDGLKNQTVDIDLLLPHPLPEALRNGVAHIARVRKLGPEWINTNVAGVLERCVIKLPGYFEEISRSFRVGDNLNVHLIGRQAMISLKLYAATSVVAKHTEDLVQLKPRREEIREAVRFVLSADSTDTRKDDLRMVLEELGFESHDFILSPEG